MHAPASTDLLDWIIAEGLTQYDTALTTMQHRVAAIRAGTAPEAVWLVEHPPLYTAGNRIRPEQLIEQLAEPLRFPTHFTSRGGLLTYHGPGQRVAYPMLDLNRPHGTVPPKDVRRYVEGLEEWLIRTLDRFNVRGERRLGRVGIWVAHGGTESKIAAIGVKLTGWITWHGVALNVEPNLTHFEGIVPCGIAEYGVTSLAALGLPITMADADCALKQAWQEVF